MKNQNLVTIYVSGAFGVQKYQGSLVDFGTRKYAQYDSAAYYSYIPKGKRKPLGCIQGYHPYIVILEGVNHPAPADPFNAPVISNYDCGDVTCKKTRYGSFDDRYLTEFDSKIEEYLKNQNVLMDIRHTVNTNILNK